MAIDTNEASLYGVGKGAAFVWGRNKALDGLERQMQQDQLRRAKEDAELSEQVGKINYDAARNEDLPEILNKYGQIKNTFTKIRGTQNQMERIKLQSALNEQKSELSRAVNLSKQAAQQLGELGKLKLTKPDELSDDFVPNYKTLNSLSVFDPKFKELAENTANTALAPKFDQLGTNEKILKTALDNLNPSDVKKQDLGGGKSSYYREKGTQLNKESLIKGVVSEVTNSKPMQRQVAKLYPNLSFQEGVKAYADDLYDQNKARFDKVERVGASIDKPDTFYDHWNYQLDHPKAQANIYVGGQPNESIYVPMGNRNQPTGNFEQRDVVKMPTASVNFAGSPAFDLKTGDKVKSALPSSNDYQIVTVSNMPFIKKGNMKGKMSQPKFAENNPDAVEFKPMIHVQYKDPNGGNVKNLAIPYDRMPQNLSKQNRALLASFKPATGSSAPKESKPSTSTPANSKSYKGLDKNGNPIFE